ncbi:MAG: zinc-binding alcohol dehydrogenase family protein [Oleiphilaceae bacterium]|jgi:zinc-binding alcohol dehydrogenase family protein
MKAIVYRHSAVNSPSALVDDELPTPEPMGRDLLVEIKAISVNPVDCKIHQNVNPEKDEQKILGWDAAGVVSSIGESVSAYKVGDKVYFAGDLTRPGCNAEYQCVDERLVGKMPASLSFSDAAALPLTAITAWELLFDRLELKASSGTSDDVILVVGAAGGVGSILIQLAKCLTTAKVIGTASREESQAWVKRMGADFVVNHHQNLEAQLKECGISSFTHVASLTHTDQHYKSIVGLMKPQAKFALIDDPIELDIKVFKRKSISIHWEFMYTRSMFQTEDMAAQQMILNEVSRLVDAGELKTTLTEHYGKINAENLAKAHQTIQTGSMLGKLVLEGF